MIHQRMAIGKITVIFIATTIGLRKAMAPCATLGEEIAIGITIAIGVMTAFGLTTVLVTDCNKDDY